MGYIEDRHTHSRHIVTLLEKLIKIPLKPCGNPDHCTKIMPDGCILIFWGGVVGDKFLIFRRKTCNISTSTDSNIWE